MLAQSPKLAVALDNIDLESVTPLIEELHSAGVRSLKVGLELYTKTGAQFVQSLKKKGFHIFLDLKLHDIPNTVAQATSAAVDLGVDVLTVHAAGGPAMLEAAAKAAQGSAMKVVAVTVLTSFSDSHWAQVAQAVGANTPDRAKAVQGLAALAAQSGVSGIVSSALDLLSNRAQLHGLSWRDRPYFVTPGIRLADNAANDQAQIATPQQAVQAGATLVVVGRPILNPSQGSRADAVSRFLRALNA